MGETTHKVAHASLTNLLHSVGTMDQWADLGLKEEATSMMTLLVLPPLSISIADRSALQEALAVAEDPGKLSIMFGQFPKHGGPIKAEAEARAAEFAVAFNFLYQAKELTHHLSTTAPH